VFQQPFDEMSFADEANVGHGFQQVVAARIPAAFRGPMCVSWEAMITSMLTDEQVASLEANRTVGSRRKNEGRPNRRNEQRSTLTKKTAALSRLTDKFAGPSPVRLVGTDPDSFDYFSWKLIGLVHHKTRKKTKIPITKSIGKSDWLRRQEKAAEETMDAKSKQPHLSPTSNARSNLKSTSSDGTGLYHSATTPGMPGNLPQGKVRTQSAPSRPRSGTGAGSRRQSSHKLEPGKFKQESKQQEAAKRRQATISLLAQQFGIASQNAKASVDPVARHGSTPQEGGDDSLLGGLIRSGGVSTGKYDEKVLATGTHAEGVLHSPNPQGFSTFFVDTDGHGLVGLQLWMKACNKDGFGHGSGRDQLLCCKNLSVHKQILSPDCLALGADGQLLEAKNVGGVDVAVEYQDMLRIYEDQLRKAKKSSSGSGGSGSFSDTITAGNGAMGNKKRTMQKSEAIQERANELMMLAEASLRSALGHDASTANIDRVESSEQEATRAQRHEPTYLPVKDHPSYKSRDLSESNTRRIAKQKLVCEGLELEYEINGAAVAWCFVSFLAPKSHPLTGKKISRADMVVSMMQKRHGISTIGS
jgi:hypothetical protein